MFTKTSTKIDPHFKTSYIKLGDMIDICIDAKFVFAMQLALLLQQLLNHKVSLASQNGAGDAAALYVRP